MSDTPRTGAAVAKFIKRTYTGACECVDAEDMRQLERENEALRKLLVDARDDVAECAGRESKPHRIKAYQEQLAAIDAAIKEQSK